MSNKSINSISTLIPDLLKLFNNYSESFDKITEAVTGTSETVALDLVDSDNNFKRIFVPSFGYIKNELERIDTNVQSLTGLGNGNSTLKLADGSYKKILQSKIDTEADSLSELNTVTGFNTKVNYFFESLSNPFMYVTYDISGQVDPTTERVLVNRFKLDLDTQSKINWFDNNYKGKTDIVYSTFLSDLLKNNVTYVPDEDTIYVAPKNLRYNGQFNIIRISDVNIDEEINGVSQTKRRKSYKLNKLSYTDSESSFDDTISLKIGDQLVVNSNPKDTRYKVVNIDSSTNSVVLELVEGYRGINIGTDILSIYSERNDSIEIQVGIGYSEWDVVFIKPIDPDSNLIAKTWSSGSAFYTNELELVDSNGNVTSLENYYKNEVTDFGSILIALSKDKIPSSIQGVKPDPPYIASTDLRVVQINKQITTNKTIADLKNSEQEKVTLSSEIKELDKAIKNKREIIATKIANNTERESDKNELKSLINERDSKNELYSSIVKEIENKSTDENLINAKPKYRVRGFFPYPELKTSAETGEQQIVKFIVAYRYLSKDGAVNQVDQLDFQDGEVSKRAAFSPWTEKESRTKSRAYSETLNQYEWVEEDVENSDEININSVDIPISKGESVEIKVRSVSEAGYPSNPIMSEYSTSVKVDFPNELNQTDIIDEIITNNKSELTRVKLQEELETIGLSEHLSTAFTANEKYFGHTSLQVSSGFLSTEQTPITLFDKLVEMDTKLKEFEEILKKTKGEIVVKFVDDVGNETLIKKGQMNKFFAGYYADVVSDLDIKKGVIVSKTFFLTIENIAATTLELISRIPGSFTKRVKMSEPENTTNIIPGAYDYYENYGSYESNDDSYNTLLKYDLVPLLLINPESEGTSGNWSTEIGLTTPYQSAQVKSQFIFSRFKDVAGEDLFYYHKQPSNEGLDTGTLILNADDAENIYNRVTVSTNYESTDFIFGGQFDLDGISTPGVGHYYTATDYDNSEDDSIDIHVSHPYFKNSASFINAYSAITGNLITQPSNGNWNVTDYAQQIIRHSKFAPLSAEKPLGKNQNMYLYDNSHTNTSHPNPSELTFDRTLKTSFEDNDKYLLGKQSCGSYLFLASDTHETISVDGKTTLSKYDIKNGSENSIRIPVIFQYRMSDYWGNADDGLGNIGGDVTGVISNITYSKRAGFDLYDSNDNIFSFDIEITAKYKSDNLNLEKIPSRQLQTALDDVKRSISGLSPSIVETKIDADR